MKSKRKIVEWQSLAIGNIVDNFAEVLKQIWCNLIHHHIWDMKWKRTIKEPELSTTIYVKNTYVNEHWEQFDECDKEEAISDYLSNKYGFCHYGFTYEEEGEVITITNIEWDEEE